MDADFRKQLEDNGADVEGTLQRFMGKEELYMKFVMRLPEDKNYEGLQNGIAGQDYTTAFECAHALKGVAANLGFNPISDIASQITELLRNKQPQEVDVEKVNELGKQLKEAYECFCRILEGYKALVL